MALELTAATACIIVAIALISWALPGKRLNAWLLRNPVAEASFPIFVLANFVVGLLFASMRFMERRQTRFSAAETEVGAHIVSGF
jgi:hypothetical protein